jgi:hypothetical protein
MRATTAMVLGFAFVETKLDGKEQNETKKLEKSF